jgi:hypothetical protein
MIRIISALALMLISVILTSAQIKSVYTSLDEKHCKSVKGDPKEKNVIYNGVCPGVGSYKLKIAASEEHQWIGLVAPSGKEFFVGTQSASYNFLGKKAEWRVRNGRPLALIVRYNLMNPEADKVGTSLLVVSKVSRTKTCVTDIVDPSKTQNEQARKLADSAGSRPCKPGE